MHKQTSAGMMIFQCMLSLQRHSPGQGRGVVAGLSSLLRAIRLLLCHIFREIRACLIPWRLSEPRGRSERSS